MLDDVLQVTPINIIHRHVGGAVFLKQRLHVDDIGMAQHGQGARLPQEQVARSFKRFCCRCGCGGHGEITGTKRQPGGETFLDRNLAVEVVTGLIGYAKAACRDPARDTVHAGRQFCAHG